MAEPEKHWKTITPSHFAWEQEALDFIHERFPAMDTYRAWANFEFFADDGSINEVDLLVACPQGVFLIEIKSRPGVISGDARDWTWEHEGRRLMAENPVILANRKCKRLKSLLSRQKAFRGETVPFIEPLVFLSDAGNSCRLVGNGDFYVRLRDTDSRSGIMGAIKRRECPGLRQFDQQVVNRPTLRSLTLAMDQAGIRPSQKNRRVGDYLLENLIFDSPLGTYQDWKAHHVSNEALRRVARIYLVATQATPAEREIMNKAAEREFEILERLDHPGILRADSPTRCELGPVLFLREPPHAVTLGQFLSQEGASLSVDKRIEILRQLGETIAYAHGQKIVHRSLSPQSILVFRKGDKPLIQIFNWQTGARMAGTDSTSLVSQMSLTLHAGQLIENSSQVFIAPEALSGGADGGTELDIFSLGALTYLLFTGKAPASSVTELQQKLKQSLSGGLNISEAMDGAVEALVEIVRDTANGTASDRVSVEDFLKALDKIEDELTAPAKPTVVSPLQARKNDILEGGYRVESRLGSGSVSVVFLVSLEDKKQVLKVARSSDYNQRIRDEFKTLNLIQDKLRSRIIVAPFALVDFGDVVGFTMEQAGEQTIARYLREEGPLDLTYLQRFGEDLLGSIRDLDSLGIAHRDIKPENMGLRVIGKKQYQLCLFDFSLSHASPEDIRVGTLAYMDPFIGERDVKRWDISSECFSAAMTLHEMATGVLPTWGDGRSDPASVKGEVKLHPERFDPDLRDRFAEFFQKALRRNFRDRFDNSEEMLMAWNKVFATLDDRKKSLTVHPDPDDDKENPIVLPANLSATTQLVLIGLSTRLLNTLDRLQLHTVGNLLAYPLAKILRLRGVGNKTRRELGQLVKLLRERLPQIETDPAKAVETANDALVASESFANVDQIASQVSRIGRGDGRGSEQQILQAFLGWSRPEGDDHLQWTNQTDLAGPLNITRQRIGQVVTEARERWQRFSFVTTLRDTLCEMIRAQGGVVTVGELVSGVLVARGSALDEPKRTQMASIATRAALETERGQETPRFFESRSGDRIFVTLSVELKNYAVSLGSAADALAAREIMPSPATVIETLRRVAPPELPEGVTAFSDQRLCQIATASSHTAALSSRLEIYPIDLDPARSLRLVQNALFGGTLTVEEVRRRVAARLPRALPLPGRPALDALMEGLGLGFIWVDTAANGRGAYELRASGSASELTSETHTSRFSTRNSFPYTQQEPEAPDIAEARVIEDKLAYAARHGSYLVLSVPYGYEPQALAELSSRFSADTCDLDEAFLTAMRACAQAARADWQVVLRADAAPRDSVDWKNLQMLVGQCLPAIQERLRSPSRTRLLSHPGLLARYDRMDLLAGLAADVGRADALFGLWVLIPDRSLNPRPLLNHQAVPLTNPAQYVRLTKAWLDNRHRAGGAVPN